MINFTEEDNVILDIFLIFNFYRVFLVDIFQMNYLIHIQIKI